MQFIFQTSNNLAVTQNDKQKRICFLKMMFLFLFFSYPISIINKWKKKVSHSKTTIQKVYYFVCLKVYFNMIFFFVVVFLFFFLLVNVILIYYFLLVQPFQFRSVFFLLSLLSYQFFFFIFELMNAFFITLFFVLFINYLLMTLFFCLIVC